MRISRTSREGGSAFVISIMVLFLLSVLGLTLVLTTTTEKKIAMNYRWGEQAFYNADAALEYGKNVLATHRMLGGDFASILPPARAAVDVTGNTDPWGVRHPEPGACDPTSAGCRDYQYFVDECPAGGGRCARIYIGRVLNRPDGTKAQWDFRNPQGTLGDLDGDGTNDIQGSFTLWVRRPMVGNADYPGNDRVILTAEGTAPTGGTPGLGRPVSLRPLCANIPQRIPTRAPGFHPFANFLMPTAHASNTEAAQKRKSKKKGQSTKGKSTKGKSTKGKSVKGKSTKGGGGGDPKEAGGCALESGSFVNIDATQMDPVPLNPSTAYIDGMRLFAIETSDCNNDGQLGLVPIELAGDPAYDGSVLSLSYATVSDSDIDGLAGTNRAVDQNCAIIGQFAVIQYRVNPLPPAQNPMLERRDYGRSEPWRPISANIENLQVQYSIGTTDNPFNDEPTVPDPDDPESWITRVRVTVTGRSESTNLQGATAGVFAVGDTHLRRTFTTTVSLRNQLGTAQETSLAQGVDGYN
ncbi:MAG: hypothetical protein E2P02_17430 [Acidobacteria bacterium]|nr:MAG: hypothetical protein E2P02_17430 [Acidobacteriota bacterium]